MLKSIQFKLLAGVVGLALMFGAGFTASSWRSDAVIAGMVADATLAKDQAIVDARAIEGLSTLASDAALEAHSLRTLDLEVVEKIVTNEVIRYVQTDTATVCGVDADWVRIHDLAASGGVSETGEATVNPDDPAAGATNAETLPVVTQNYGVCRSTREQLIALQDWATSVYQAATGDALGSGKIAGPSSGV